jgi:hypothetical protein
MPKPALIGGDHYRQKRHQGFKGLSVSLRYALIWNNGTLSFITVPDFAKNRAFHSSISPFSSRTLADKGVKLVS